MVEMAKVHTASDGGHGEMQTRVRCGVCPHACMIAPGSLGVCMARRNVEGAIVDENYGQATALALDPIEKKPLARFHPGAKILSYGSYGCNLRCAFCQNSDISLEYLTHELNTVYIAPDELVAKARELASAGNIGIALTYNEPFIAPEYLLDVGTRAHDAGLLLVVVTNGYVNADVLERMLPVIDALNIDLKCFNEDGYRLLGAKDGLSTVKTTIERSVANGAHVEVTTLVVPGISDDPDEFAQECAWLSLVSPLIPLHISRFFPQYKMQDRAATPVSLMHEFERIARRYLEYVYLGNV